MTRGEIVDYLKGWLEHPETREVEHPGTIAALEGALALLAPDPRREELAAWCEAKAAWYIDRAENARSAHGVRDTYHTDADCATKIAALLRGGR